MPELVTVACSWVIAVVRAPMGTTALPPITAASIFTLVRLFAVIAVLPF
jgi:hypothetical protein